MFALAGSVCLLSISSGLSAQTDVFLLDTNLLQYTTQINSLKDQLKPVDSQEQSIFPYTITRSPGFRGT